MTNPDQNRRPRWVFVALACAVVGAGCASLEQGTAPAAVPEIRPGFLMGYLLPPQLPNSLALLPAPPVAGSAGNALDDEIASTNLGLRDTPRWALAAEDAQLAFPQAAGTFTCALGAPINEESTPHLYVLLRRSLTDAGLSTYQAKDHYDRARPFMVNGAPLCTPDERAMLEKDGSYPSGHTAIGWAWALILAEIEPDRSDAILARGLAFGESRNVCNVHWHSDVVQGRVMGAATVARLHADSVFRADVEAAKAELAAVRAKNLPPARDCSVEKAALGLR